MLQNNELIKELQTIGIFNCEKTELVILPELLGKAMVILDKYGVELKHCPKAEYRRTYLYF